MLGLDIDGVLADFTYSFRQLAARYYNVPVYSNGGQQTWDWPEITPEQENKLWRKIDGFPFWRNMYPLLTHGEIEQLRDRAHLDRDIAYITSRKDIVDTLSQTRDWLEAHGFPYPHKLYSARDKSPIIQKLGITDFIDDNPRHLREIEGCKVWVRDWPYNRLPEFEHLPRVSSIAEWLRNV